MQNDFAQRAGIPNPEFQPTIPDSYGTRTPNGRFSIDNSNFNEIEDQPSDFPPHFTVDPDELTDQEFDALSNAFPDDFPLPESTTTPYTDPTIYIPEPEEHTVINPNKIDPKTGEPFNPEGGFKSSEEIFEDFAEHPEEALEDLIGGD